MRIRMSRGFLAVVLSLGVSGTSVGILLANAAGKPASGKVEIDNFTFGPSTVSVAPGTTITWTNRDDIPHTVMSIDGVFRSKALDTDEAFSYTFSKAGTYDYYCSIHPKMTGKVVVR
jgi:amicyanin